jgi:SAM-dependent methyltransferase
MIFSKDVLFLHVPKTGGTSVTRHLLEVLPAPVYYVRPDGVEEDYAQRDGVVQIAGPRHASLPQAVDLLGEYDLGLADFKLILAAIRNPYSLEVSRYHYLRRGHPEDVGRNQRLALTRDFSAFAAESSFGASGQALENYFHWENRFPPNLTIARFESLEADVKQALESIEIASHEAFHWMNKSRHADFASYYTREGEEAVFNKYRWVFDAGLYERMPALGERDGDKQRPLLTHTLPIVGPVRQEGPAAGFGRDCRVDGDLKTTLLVKEFVSDITLDGRIPKLPGASQATLTLSANGQKAAASFQSGQPFTWTVPLVLTPKDPTELTLDFSATWPKNAGARAKKRKLALTLNRLVFTSVSRLMKSEWDRRARENAMHYVNPTRTECDDESFFETGQRDTEQQVVDDLDAICGGADPKRMRVLEIGCGVGRMTTYLGEVFGKVRGVDVSRAMLSLARARVAQQPNIAVHGTNGTDLTRFRDNRFDFCFSFRTFQRIPVREVVVNYFREVHRTLKKGRLFKFQVQGVAPGRPPDTWNGVAFSEQELRELADAIGFDVLKMEGQGTEYFWNWWVRR